MNLTRLDIATNSAEQTEQVAEKIGKRLRGGEVIELVSDLGGGKTTFVRGLVRGFGSTDHVSSPTFKLSNIYKSGNLEIQHFDFYRLNEAGIVADELAEVIGQPNVVAVIEWGEIVHDVLPQERVTITIKNTSETSRTLIFELPKSLVHIVESFHKV